jgi:hypothetical protein
MTELSATDIDSLRAGIAGEVLRASDPGWDEGRQAWNLVADQRPALVVVASSTEDVVATVRFARAHGLRVAPQGTGHGATAIATLDDTILLRTGRLNRVEVDPEARLARVQAGACWVDVAAATARHGLVALHGFSGTVGVAGYLLGGGIGWLARSHGFCSTHVRSLDVVTAAGEQLQVDATREPELFWALRGGGGGPVIVTSFEIDLFPLAELFGGTLAWPIEQAHDVVHAYRAWIATVPESVTSTVRLMRFPPLPQLPEPLRGKQLVLVTLAFAGSQTEGDELVAPLRAVAPPSLDLLAMMPGAKLGELAGDPPGPLPGLGGALLLDTFTEEAADAFLALGGPGQEIPLLQLEVRHLGGALARPRADAGAAGALGSRAMLYGVGPAATPELGHAIKATLGRAAELFAPWTSARPNLVTFDEGGRGLRVLFEAEVADRLARVTATYDPDGRLVAAQMDGRARRRSETDH